MAVCDDGGSDRTVKTYEVVADVDEERRLAVTLPETAPWGRARVIVMLPEDEDEAASAEWMSGIAREWAEELADEREDLYTLEDGEPVDTPR